MLTSANCTHRASLYSPWNSGFIREQNTSPKCLTPWKVSFSSPHEHDEHADERRKWWKSLGQWTFALIPRKEESSHSQLIKLKSVWLLVLILYYLLDGRTHSRLQWWREEAVNVTCILQTGPPSLILLSWEQKDLHERVFFTGTDQTFWGWFMANLFVLLAGRRLIYWSGEWIQRVQLCVTAGSDFGPVQLSLGSSLSVLHPLSFPLNLKSTHNCCNWSYTVGKWIATLAMNDECWVF